GRHRAQLAGSSNYEHRSAPTGRRSVDAIDKGVGDISADTARAALASNTNHLGADIDVIGTRCLIVAGTKAQGRVLIAGVVAKERPITTGGVVVAGGVERKRSSADGCVSNAGGVGSNRSITVCRVAMAGVVEVEGQRSVGRVVASSGVFPK